MNAEKIIAKTALLQTLIFGIKVPHVHIYLLVHKHFLKTITILKYIFEIFVLK